MEIGLFFGTFNPIHNGHLLIAKKAIYKLKLDQVWFVLSPLSPFKENKKDREKIFGDIDNWDNWNKSLQILKDYVIEARTYKKGYGGLASLKNDESTQLSSFKNIKNIIPF